MGTEADLTILAEQRAHHVTKGAFQVGEGNTLVDSEPLDLMEDWNMRRVGRIPPIHAPERDHVDRRLTILHRVDLRGRSLCPEHGLVVEVERGERGACRMPGRHVESGEVVVGRFDLATVDHLVAEAEEYVLYLATNLRDQVEMPGRGRNARQRDVDDFLGKPSLELFALERALPSLDGLRKARARLVQRAASLLVTDLSQRLGQHSVSPEIAHTHSVQRVR